MVKEDAHAVQNYVISINKIFHQKVTPHARRVRANVESAMRGLSLWIMLSRWNAKSQILAPNYSLISIDRSNRIARHLTWTHVCASISNVAETHRWLTKTSPRSYRFFFFLISLRKINCKRAISQEITIFSEKTKRCFLGGSLSHRYILVIIL